MKVLINAFSARQGGGQTYLVNILRYLPVDMPIEIIVMAPESIKLPDSQHNVSRMYSRWNVENPFIRTIWEKVVLPRLLQKNEIDVLFCPGGVIGTRVREGCKTVTMFRNMIPFDIQQRKKYPVGYMRLRNWILRKMMLRSILSADLVIFISKYAKQVIEKSVNRPLGDSVVIPHGINPAFRFSNNQHVTRPSWLPEGDYLLYVSIFLPHKVQVEIVKGYALLKQQRKNLPKLVLIGSEATKYGQCVREEVRRHNLEEDIQTLGEVPHAELPVAYSHARIIIFASECENCPNILLESMAAARPMLVSKFQPMPEFGGDAAIYFDPSSPENFAEKLGMFLDNPKLQKELSIRALERSKLYDWGQTAERTWNNIFSLKKKKDTKILCVNMSIDAITGGGTAERTIKIFQFMQKAGARCSILATDQGISLSPDVVFPDVEVELVHCLVDRFYFPIFSLRKLERIVASSDYIHLMSHWTVINAIVYLLARRLKKPYTICPAGSLIIFGRSVLLKKIYNLVIGNRIVMNAKHCIAITAKEADDFTAYNSTLSKRITIIPNGIDRNTYFPDDISAKTFREKHGLADVPFILYLGRLNEIKGPDLLLKAFAEIQDEFPDYHIVVAGPDEGLGDELANIVHTHQLDERVHFLGYVGGRDKVGAYSASDLLVIPSRREAMSIVALEAGACATPVLLTDQCGFDEVGEAGGKVVSPTVEGLCKGLRQMLMDREGLKERGLQLRSMILKQYTWEKAAESYLKLSDPPRSLDSYGKVALTGICVDKE